MSVKWLEARNAKSCLDTASSAVVRCISPPIMRKAIHTPPPSRTTLARRSWIQLNKMHAALTQWNSHTSIDRAGRTQPVQVDTTELQHLVHQAKTEVELISKRQAVQILMPNERIDLQGNAANTATHVQETKQCPSHRPNLGDRSIKNEPESYPKCCKKTVDEYDGCFGAPCTRPVWRLHDRPRENSADTWRPSRGTGRQSERIQLPSRAVAPTKRRCPSCTSEAIDPHGSVA